uniref:Chemokine interleukin-8-like domain-containing protein n=1 Tax=Electrophorus electricus TaxID=8005 RepID=A0A4W4E5J5_ELEEL
MNPNSPQGRRCCSPLQYIYNVSQIELRHTRLNESLLKVVQSLIIVLSDFVWNYCCYKPTQNKVPLKRIVSYNWTRSDCSIKAVVFKMISGKEICVDPASDWVNDHMKAVDQRTVSTTGNPTSTPAT